MSTSEGPPENPVPLPPGGDPAPVDAHAVIEVHRRPHRRSRFAWWGVALLAAGLVTAGMAVVVDAAPPGPAAPKASASALPTPVLSARRVPQWTTQPVARRRLAEALDPIVATAPGSSCVGVGDGSNPWYAHNTTAALAPASNMKLLTAAAALDILDADTTFTTSFRTAAPLAPGGVVAGDLFVVGGGDPVLTTEGYQARQRSSGRFPETDLEAVADKLVAAGVRTITGSVVGDASRYDGEQAAAGWPARFEKDGTVAPLSALMVNDAWQVDPLTGAGTGSPAADPAAHAATVITQLLQARGVHVGGMPRSGVTPAQTASVLDVASLPVSALVAETLSFSDNTSAELLVKEIGHKAAGTGSTVAGTGAVLEWARQKGFPMQGVAIVDGSGLGDANRLTCDFLAAVLRSTGPSGQEAAGLAVPGKPGTLKDRFGGAEWTLRLRAKTGTLLRVTSLSGWLKTRPGATLDFQILENTGDHEVTIADIAFQDRVLTALLDHPIAPPVAEAGPLPTAPA